MNNMKAFIAPREGAQGMGQVEMKRMLMYVGAYGTARRAGGRRRRNALGRHD
jgi:hypothetical protein